MRISALILMSPLPAAWIAVGSLLLLLVVVMTILFLLKSREVSTLKKQCDELRDTMRMMRYEEANLARMLHTASKPVEPIETPEEEDVEEKEFNIGNITNKLRAITKTSKSTSKPTGKSKKIKLDGITILAIVSALIAIATLVWGMIPNRTPLDIDAPIEIVEE